MKKVIKKLKALCTAVSCVGGTYKLKGADDRHEHTLKKAKKKYVDNRPKLQL